MNDKSVKGKQQSPKQPEQITVADLARFPLWLPSDERERVIDLLRAIQDRRWQEVWPEPIIVGDARE